MEKSNSKIFQPQIKKENFLVSSPLKNSVWEKSPTLNLRFCGVKLTFLLMQLLLIKLFIIWVAKNVKEKE